MRAISLACPAFLGPGGISSYARRVVEALAPEPCEILGQGRAPKLFPVPAGARYLGSPETQPAFVARFATEFLRRPPTWFVFAHVGLTRPLGLLPARSGHRVSLLLHGIEAWVPLSNGRASGLRRVDSFVFTTDYSRAMFLNFNAAAIRTDAETIVLPLSADGALEATRPGPVRQGRRRVLCVTRLTRDEPLKGISTLLRAAARLNPAEWEITIAGDGDGRAAYEQEASRLGVADRVTFTGWIDDAARTQALLDADVFCLPSGQEGFGIVFLEAMIAGRPCVGAAAGAVPEVLPPSVGALFPLGDAGALAAALRDTGERLRSGAITPESIRAIYDARYPWSAFRTRWQTYATRMRG